MAKAPSFGKDQTGMYHKFNPEDTEREMATPWYGRGKITHSKPEQPAPGTPPNTMGHQHVNTGGKGKKK